MKNEGICIFDGSKYVIKIKRDRSDLSQIDSLIHEYAHAVDGLQGTDDEHRHTDTWGVAYAQVYKIYEMWANL